MTVTELLTRIMAAYAGATPEAMKTFVPVFHARLRKHEGERLDEAAIEVLGTFKPKFDQKFPIPADFEKHLPSTRLDLPKETPKLDFRAHKAALDRIMADWRNRQALKASKGVSQVLRALEDYAKPLADMMAWLPGDNRLVLDREQLRIAKQRAVSLQRRIKHGMPTANADLWWDQIAEIQQRWGIELTREDWTAKTPEKAAA